MLQKIKSMVELSNQIKELKTDFEKIKNEINSIKKFYSDEIKSNKDLQKKELSEISEIKNDLKILKENFSKKLETFNEELRSFNITKKNIQEKLYNEFETESKKISSEMKNHLSNYLELEVQMKNAGYKIKDFTNSINEMKQLSETISKKDFELKNYAKILEKNDNEKVQLLKKIDYLERLLASMRRTNKR